MNIEVIAYLSAFLANLIIWLAREYLPADKRAAGAILIVVTLIVYGVASAATQQTLGQMLEVARLLEVLLAAAGINLAGDVVAAPNGRIGIQRSWRSALRSIVR